MPAKDRALSWKSARRILPGVRRPGLRLESVGEMFLSTFIQHSVRQEELNLPLDELDIM